MLFIVIGIWLGFFVSKKCYFGEKRDVIGVSMYCLFGAALLWLISIPISSQFTIPQNQLTVVSKVDLVSLRNTDSTSGNFFLGTGSIGDTRYYSYYKVVGEDGYRPERMEFADNITIYEDTYKPYIIKYHKYSEPIENPKLFPWFFTFRQLGGVFDEVIEIHIPKGTLKRNFVLE